MKVSLLDLIQKNQEAISEVIGFTIYGQQVLSAISFVLFIITLLFTHFVVSKQKVMIQ